MGLPPGWDSYGALSPTREALQYAWMAVSALVEQDIRSPFPVPQVFPVPNGGVQLEWHSPRASLEWEIDADAEGGVFVFDDRDTGERLDGEMPSDLQVLAKAISRIAAG